MKLATLPEQFNLTQNPTGAGIMYFLDRLDAHRDQVVTALESMGMRFESNGVTLGIIGSIFNLKESPRQRLNTLLEELLIINEASDYHQMGFNPRTYLSDLDQTVRFRVNNKFITGNKQGLGDYLRDEVLPLVNELQDADENRCLYRNEREIVEGLSKLCKNYLNSLGDQRTELMIAAVEE